MESNEEFQNEIQKLKNQLQEKKARLSNLEKQNGFLQKDLECRKGELSSMSKHVKDLQKTLVAKENIICGLRAQGASNKLTQCEEKLKSLEAENSELKYKLSSTTAQFRKDIEQVADKQKKLDAIRANDKMKYQRQLKQMEDEKEQYKLKFSVQRQETTQLKMVVAKMQKEIEDLKNENTKPKPPEAESESKQYNSCPGNDASRKEGEANVGEINDKVSYWHAEALTLEANVHKLECENEDLRRKIHVLEKDNSEERNSRDAAIEYVNDIASEIRRQINLGSNEDDANEAIVKLLQSKIQANEELENLFSEAFEVL